MLQRLVRGHAGVGIDGQAASDEVAGWVGDVAPVFDGCEGVVGGEDGLHFFQVGVAVEWCVAAEEEVGDDADGPDVAVHASVKCFPASSGLLTLVCRGRSS